MQKNHGIKFEYDKEKKECRVTNDRFVSMYGIELLFRVSGLKNAFKYRKIMRLKPGESKKINVKSAGITDIDLVRYEYQELEPYVCDNIPMWLCVILFAGIIYFLVNICSSFTDAIIGIIFVSLFPVCTVIMNLGARYDSREEEKHYYSVLDKK